MRGKCGEIEAISEYLLNAEALYGIRIQNLAQALRYTRGCKMQTRIVKTGKPIDPCETCTPLESF